MGRLTRPRRHHGTRGHRYRTPEHRSYCPLDHPRPPRQERESSTRSTIAITIYYFLVFRPSTGLYLSDKLQVLECGCGEQATMSVTQTILRSARSRGRGAVFSAADFNKFGSRAAVDQALSRLSRRGAIRRICRGMYDLPKTHPRVGQIAPAPDAVARAVARKTRGRLQMSGPASANALGLSTQVPARSVYLTSGPSRRIPIGRQSVVLEHSSSPALLFPGTPAGMVIAALQYLGPEGASPGMLQHLSTRLDDTDKNRLKRIRRRVPGWLASAIDQIH